MSELQPLVDALFGRDPVAADQAVLVLADRAPARQVIEAVIPLSGGGHAPRPATEQRLGRLVARLGPGVLPHLERCLRQGAWSVKLAAAPCFAGLAGHDEAQDVLVAMLKSVRDFDTERLALEALGWLGNDGWAWDIEHYGRTGQWLRPEHEREDAVSRYEYGKLSSYALEAIARLAAGCRDNFRIDALFRLLDETLRRRRQLQPNVAPSAIDLLDRHGHAFTERHVDAIIGTWGHDAETALQGLCTTLLGHIAPVRAASFLFDVVTAAGRDGDVRRGASEALGELRSASVAQRMAAALADPSTDRSSLDWAASALYAAGGDWAADPSFYAGILARGGVPAAQLRYGLAVRGDRRAQADLVTLLDAREPFVRWTAALALARLLGRDSRPYLQHRVEDAGDDLERCAMLAATIRAGEPGRVDALHQALQQVGALPALRRIWLIEILDALRIGRPDDAGLFEAWVREARVSERALRYFDEWGRAAPALPATPAQPPMTRVTTGASTPAPAATATAAAAPPPHPPPAPTPPQVFVSYSHKDRAWLKRFQAMLSPLQRNQRLAVWDDTLIVPGQWKPQIDAAMRQAHVALFLVSPNFLASDFVAQNELPEMLQLAESCGLRIVWVLLGPCFWDQTALSGYQCVNAGRPLSGLKAADRDGIIHAACTQVLLAAG